MGYKTTYPQIIAECGQALSMIDEQTTQTLIDAILGADKVFCVGVGRVLLSLQAICKRFNHLGIPCYFVGEIVEPAITERDILIVGSGSGESLVPVSIAKKAKLFGAKVALISSNPRSTLTSIADIFVRIPVQTKLGLPDELNSVQPMTSLFEQSLLLYGDSLAKLIIDQKHLDIDALWQYHANLE
ncbi:MULTISPECIES: 6-phospho-3-hexuloisomerase [Anaerotruncus]|uniref:SIS domain-containing protein n=2 Tax=Anaerotruncus TaxID=244127 RepID=A0A498D0S1_9FIRM|nr:MULTISPECIES: 6-phospho-3-hexuloisomerase [Anaerotruncus]MBC3937955.1 SIS domain-containing protein [Anaerotruncus massiliensis (ex Togo et al. 2019)]MCQ4897115.1 SIS domain-containing protein [Anaerotruncus sp. DFI.9.16]RLL13530.1 SIS domain-containing protein [Anaerotruncus massiliensis (ex Liu et al. 2021)]